jgi:hypothetical protein
VTKALIGVGAALVLCFAVLGAAVFLTREEDRIAVDSDLAEDITRAIATSEDREEPVDLARLADFPWDRVLIVAEDTSREAISQEIGTEFKGDLPYDAESGEIFVFVRGRELARFADYRGLGRFEGIERPIASVQRADAVFDVQDLVVTPAG